MCEDMNYNLDEICKKIGLRLAKEGMYWQVKLKNYLINKEDCIKPYAQTLEGIRKSICGFVTTLKGEIYAIAYVNCNGDMSAYYLVGITFSGGITIKSDREHLSYDKLDTIILF